MRSPRSTKQRSHGKNSLTAMLYGIGVAAVIAGVLSGSKPALAHNLQTKIVYTFFDAETQQMLDNRIAGNDPLYPNYAPPEPLLKVNDEIGLIVKVIPRDGTTTGVGGHIDSYIPNGTRVIDVGYVLPNLSGGYDKVPMKGQSPIALGAGTVGAKATAELATLTGTYTNILA